MAQAHRQVELVNTNGQPIQQVDLSAATIATIAAAVGASTGTADASLPTGAILQNFSRFNFMQAETLSSTRLLLSTGPEAVIPAGKTVNSITFVTATTPVLASATHQWFCITDMSANILAVTSDDTSTAWAANTGKTLTFATPYTPSVATQIYGGICVVATTTPGVLGVSTASGGTGIAALSPTVGGQAASGLSGPPTVGTSGGPIAAGNIAYWYLS